MGQLSYGESIALWEMRSQSTHEALRQRIRVFCMEPNAVERRRVNAALDDHAQMLRDAEQDLKRFHSEDRGRLCFIPESGKLTWAR